MLDLRKPNFRKVRLVSNRLLLREVPLGERRRFFEIFSDKEVLRYTDRELTATIDEAVLFLKDCQMRAEKKLHLFLGIFRKTDERLLGILSLYHIDAKHSLASLGFLLAKEHWRQGYMCEALLGFLEFCFLELGFHRIEAQTYVGNTAAIKFFESLKFTKEARLRENFRIDGKFESSYLFSMLKSDYIKLHCSGQ